MADDADLPRFPEEVEEADMVDMVMGQHHLFDV